MVCGSMLERGRGGGRGSLQGWENTFYPFLPSHFSYTFFFFSQFCGKSRAKAQLISDFTEPGFRKLKGHPVPSSETLTSIESPP